MPKIIEGQNRKKAFHFPLAGLDLSMGYQRQPTRPMASGDYARTTPVGVNVRAFDLLEKRARGGMRPGIAKYATNQVNSSNFIQNLSAVSVTGLITGGVGALPGWGIASLQAITRSSAAVALTHGGAPEWSYTLATNASAGRGSASTACIEHVDGTYAFATGNGQWHLIQNGSLVASGNLPANANRTTVSVCTDGTAFYAVGLNLGTTAPGLGTFFALKVAVAGTVTWTQTNAGNITPPAGTTALNANGQTASVVSSGVLYTSIPNYGITSLSTTDGTASGTGTRATQATIVAAINAVLPLPGWRIDPGKSTATTSGPVGQLAVIGSTLAVAVRNISSGGNLPQINVGQLGVVYINTASGAATPTANALSGAAVFNAVNPPSFLSLTDDGTDFYALAGNTDAGLFASNNKVYKLDGTTGATSWTTSSFETVLHAIDYSSALTKLVVSGPAASLALSVSDGSVSGEGFGMGLLSISGGATVVLASDVADGGETASGANYNRALCLLAVAGGTPKVLYQSTWQSMASGGTGSLSSTVAVIRSTDHRGKVFFVDGGSNYAYYDPYTNKFNEWTATAGTLPTDVINKKAKLITTWRDRIVLAGLPGDEKNAYLSKTGDSFNWDYDPTSQSALAAVALNLSTVGRIPDVITALVPWSDDVLIWGCDHTIWKLVGDPRAGGSLDLVTNAIGMAWGDAWCVDPYGKIYFLSNLGGVYRLEPDPGKQPVRISQQVEQLIDTINLDNSIVRMMWDDRMQGFHLLATNWNGAQPAQHYFWEERTQAWWVDKFADDNHNPLCCLAYQGNTATSRANLIGSWDGYVRYYTTSAGSDDGEDISSEVVLGPVTGDDGDEFLQYDLQAIMGETSGPVTYAVHVGTTAEKALASDAVETGTWTAGREWVTPARWRGHTIWLKITSTNAWAMESVLLRYAGRNKVAGRQGR